jgi:arylsulfatase A-like enzyme
MIVIKIMKYILITLLILFHQSCTLNKTDKKPNIIFIMSDDHANKAISSYHRGLIETPNIDRIADEGLLFQNAFVTNSICAPSRAVILTGKFSHLNGVTGNGQVFDGDQVTFPKLLQGNGYSTALIGKWHLKSSPTGFDYHNVLPGQGDYYNPDFIQMGRDTTYSGYVTDIITDLSLDWLKNRPKDAPFCLVMQHKAPHRSWMPAQKHLDLFNDKTFDLPENFYDSYENRLALQRQQLTVRDHMDIRMDYKVPCDTCEVVSVHPWAPAEHKRRIERLTHEERKLWDEAYRNEAEKFYELHHGDTLAYDRWKYQRYMEDYLRCIASVDESVGRVLDYLEDSGMDENTIIIYTSDQGFYLGEHGLFDKRFMYEEGLRTPLMIRFPPEITPKTNSELFVQNLDIAPTLLDMAGINVPVEMQGLSLRNIWKQEIDVWRDAIYYHYYEDGFGATPHYGLRTERYKLIHFYGPVDSWELYDLKNDPSEMNNLYNDTGKESLIAELKYKLGELKAQYGDNDAQIDFD